MLFLIYIKHYPLFLLCVTEKSSLGDDWAAAMLKDTSNPAFLRQIIEDFKLKTIQDLNTLKRLVRQAETDHYALYRYISGSPETQNASKSVA